MKTRRIEQGKTFWRVMEEDYCLSNAYTERGKLYVRIWIDDKITAPEWHSLTAWVEEKRTEGRIWKCQRQRHSSHFLRENGYKGLCDPDYCGCGIDDLFSCCGPGIVCQAAMSREENGEIIYYVPEEKP